MVLTDTFDADFFVRKRFQHVCVCECRQLRLTLLLTKRCQSLPQLRPCQVSYVLGVPECNFKDSLVFIVVIVLRFQHDGSVQNYVVHSNHTWSGSPGAPKSGQVVFSSIKNSASPLQDMLHAVIPRAILLQGHVVTIPTLLETQILQLPLVLLWL